MGADENSYLPKSQVSKVKSNTFDSANANRELPRTVTPGEMKTLPAENMQKKVIPPVGEKSIIEIKGTHTPEQVQAIIEYKASVDNDVFRFVEKIKNLKDKNVASKLNKSFGSITERAKKDIKKLTEVNAEGYEHNINGSAVQNIERQHGINGTANQIMRNSEDVTRIKYILENMTM